MPCCHLFWLDDETNVLFIWITKKRLTLHNFQNFQSQKKIEELPFKLFDRRRNYWRSVVLFSFCLVFFIFLLFVVNIVVVIRLRVPMTDDGQILSTCCVSASVVEKRKGLFEHLKRKKTTSSAWRSSRKKLRHSRTEKKTLYTRSLDQLLLFSSIAFFHSVVFLVSFFRSLVLCIFYYNYPHHVMMLTRTFVNLALLRCFIWCC